MLVLLVIGGTQVFTQIYLMTGGGPYNSTQVLFTYAYQQAFTNFEFGYAAAIASMMAVVVFGFSVAEIQLLRRRTARRNEPGTIRTLPARRDPAAGSGTARRSPGMFGIRSWRKTAPGHRAPVRGGLALPAAVHGLAVVPAAIGGPQRHPVLVPTHPTTANYIQAWTENSFGHFFVNSLYVSLAPS